jgi:hypothetical protein
MNIPLVAVTVTRDAMTRLAVTVPAHEVDLQRTVFGEDNVQITSEDTGAHVELDPSAEGERLVGKYGDAAVVKQYGENYKGAVARALSSYEASSKPKGKALAPA